MGKYDFIMGLDPRREQEAEDKMRQESEMMRARVERRGPSAVSEYENVPMVGDEDSPEQHQNLMGAGRKLAGEFDGIDMIGGAARDLERRASAPRMPAPSADGLQGIQDTALSILARAQARGRR